MMPKKILAVVLSLLMTMLFLAGCSNPEGGGGENTVIVTRNIITYLGTNADGEEYSLKITESSEKAQRSLRSEFTPGAGDLFLLKANGMTSEGLVQTFIGSILTLLPDGANATFSAEVSSAGLLSLTGTITWNDGNTEDKTGGLNPGGKTTGTENVSTNQLIRDGNAALSRKNYDQAVALYEAAFNADNNNAKAIIYSTLAKIAKISTDPKVVNLFRNRFGFTNYPNQLNALFSDKWLTNYTSERYQWSYQDNNGNWIYWRDRWYVNNPQYEGVNQVGYYRRNSTRMVFVSDEPRWGERSVYSYYDENGNYIRWFDRWDANYYGLDRVGYYIEDWRNNTYTFVSDVRKYEPVEVGYEIRVDGERIWVNWYDKGYEFCYDNCNNYPTNWIIIDRAGYYYDVSAHTLVSTTPRIEETWTTLLPGLDTPNWIKGGSDSWYNQSLTSRGVPSFETWALLLFANAVDKNPNGLNDAIDETIAAVFGSSFNEALARIKRLESRKNERITLDRAFIEALHLEDFTPIDEYSLIGWAEINAITSAMVGIKAACEWVAAYDWSMNLNFFKGNAWKPGEDYWLSRIRDMPARDLPFNNNFLKARPGKMAAAKASFIQSIRGIQASYDAILNSDLYITEIKNAHATLNDGINKLIAAIEGGGRFWVPEDPTKGGWPTSATSRHDVLFGVDMGKFFQEGYFSLPNIYETENGKPVFYADGVKLTKANYLQRIENAQDFIGMKYKTINLKNLIFGISEIDELPNEEIIPMFSPELAKILFEKYNP